MRPLLHKIGIITYLERETEREAGRVTEGCRQGGVERESAMRGV